MANGRSNEDGQNKAPSTWSGPRFLRHLPGKKVGGTFHAAASTQHAIQKKPFTGGGRRLTGYPFPVASRARTSERSITEVGDVALEVG